MLNDEGVEVCKCGEVAVLVERAPWIQFTCTNDAAHPDGRPVWFVGVTSPP